MFNNFFFLKIVPFMRECGKTWQSRTGHRWQYSRVHALHMLGNWHYEHTLWILNTNCLFTATMHLSGMLHVHCLFC